MNVQPSNQQNIVNLQYDKNCDHKKLKFQVRMQFTDVKECRDAVKLWAISNKRNIKWKKSEHDRLLAVCEKPCPWMLYASKLTRQPTCVIKSYVAKHTCVKLVRNRQANSSWVSDYFAEMLKTNPTLQPRQMMNELWSKFGISVTLMMCRRSRSRALEKIWGSLESHYMKLTPYLTELRN